MTDLLIKGMEMPESCYGCPLSEQREETDMGARFTYMVDCKKNSFDDGTFEGRRKTRPDWCPLIEVPTPHGQLKDADELIKHDHQHYEHLSDEFYITVRDIENAPTVIEAEK